MKYFYINAKVYSFVIIMSILGVFDSLQQSIESFESIAHCEIYVDKSNTSCSICENGYYKFKVEVNDKAERESEVVMHAWINLNESKTQNKAIKDSEVKFKAQVENIKAEAKFICKPCLKPCLHCKGANGEICQSCIDSYYLNKEEGRCEHCSKGCKICKSKKNCQSCIVGYYKENSQCISDSFWMSYQMYFWIAGVLFTLSLILACWLKKTPKRESDSFNDLSSKKSLVKY